MPSRTKAKCTFEKRLIVDDVHEEVDIVAKAVSL